MGELLVYGRRLGVDEVYEVEAYLARKWGVAIADSWTSVPEDVLPVGTDVFVDEGATLDLCGATQTVRQHREPQVVEGALLGHIGGAAAPQRRGAAFQVSRARAADNRTTGG